jgi:hypothetical protein
MRSRRDLRRAKIHDLLQVRVGLILGQKCSQFDRNLFVTDRRLECALVGRVQPIDHRLLVLLGSPDLSEGQLQVWIESRAHVFEAQRLRFDAVHQNDAHSRERIIV